MIALEHLHAVLDELGRLESTDAVAYHLLGQGVSGVRNDASSCPLAAYVKQRLPVSCAWAYPSHIAVYYADGYMDTTDVPDMVRAFMTLFDQGVYPFLDAELASTPAQEAP